jgi:hypothetical protein
MWSSLSFELLGGRVKGRASAYLPSVSDILILLPVFSLLLYLTFFRTRFFEIIPLLVADIA